MSVDNYAEHAKGHLNSDKTACDFCQNPALECHYLFKHDMPPVNDVKPGDVDTCKRCGKVRKVSKSAVLYDDPAPTDADFGELFSYQVVITRTNDPQAEVCRVTVAAPDAHKAVLSVTAAILDGTMHRGGQCSEKTPVARPQGRERAVWAPEPRD